MSNMKLLLPVLAMAASWFVGADEPDFFPRPSAEQASDGLTIETCSIACLNNGTCAVNDDGEPFCLCPTNFFGSFCEETGAKCGGNYCYHTSKCLEIHLADGSSEHVCDCTSAFTDETYYAGEFCQYPSTQFCSGGDDPNGRQFCVNNGKCPLKRHQACDCPEGFTGPRCAFQIGVDGSDYSECDLPCQNGGTCQKGLKDAFSGELFEKFDLDIAHILETHGQQHVNYEHCVCPEGYFGIRCEYLMEQCGEGEHLCFHGSECVRYDDMFGCDCESSDQKVAGLFCENIATSLCEQWVDSENGHRGFCTNGGKCIVDVVGSPSCTCPSGYNGKHCEFRMNIGDVDPFSQQTEKEDNNGISVSGIFGITIIATGTIAGTFAILLYHRNVRTARGNEVCCDSSRTTDGNFRIQHPAVEARNDMGHLFQGDSRGHGDVRSCLVSSEVVDRFASVEIL